MIGADASTFGRHAALRFVFRLTASGFELVSRDPVAMTPLPGHDVHADHEQLSGSRIELQDDQGNVLYRRTGGPTPDPHAEIYTDDPEQPFMRSVTPPIGSLVSVVVPDDPNAQAVVLFGNPQSVAPAEELPEGPARRSSRFAAARELARIPVRDGEARAP
jgi:hypothetical protein